VSFPPEIRISAGFPGEIVGPAKIGSTGGHVTRLNCVTAALQIGLVRRLNLNGKM